MTNASMVRAIASVIAALSFAALVATASHANVPPHNPGTVCYTPNFWCWARPPGPPGSPCTCPNPNRGPRARGTLG